MSVRFKSSEVLEFVVGGRPPCAGNFDGRLSDKSTATKKFIPTYKSLARLVIKQAIYEQGWTLDDKPLYVVLTVYLRKPRNASVAHVKNLAKGRELLNRAPSASRMCNIFERAMVGLVYKRSTQITAMMCVKRYSEDERVEVLVGKPETYADMAYDLRNA